MESVPPYGNLYIVATPIGNLEDITFRAVNVLKQVDLIAAEDTRHSRKLLSHFGIDTRLISCHEHNEAEKTEHLINQLKKGCNIALISDAGTPCISDPGYFLVKKASNEKIKVTPIPGCSASIAGLSASGLPTDSFLFLGFLPKKKQKLVQSMDRYKEYPGTLIVYESPKRIKKTVQILINSIGNRKACLARELTKLHEEFIRGRLTDILTSLESKQQIKGEIVLFISGREKPSTISIETLKTIIQDRLKTEKHKTSELARILSKEYGISKKTVYDLIIKSGKIKT